MNPANLRIALVGPLPPPAGGMANQAAQLARLLEQEGVRVELVRTNAPYRPSWIANLRYLREPFRLMPYLARLWRAVGRAQLVHVMANSGLSWHLCAAPAVWMARVRRVPLILNYRGGGAERFLQNATRAVTATLSLAASIV